MAASGIDRHLAPIGGRAIRMRTPGARPRHPAGFSVSARPDLTSFACSAQWRSGTAASRVAAGAAGLLHYAGFSAVRYWVDCGIPVSIALLTIGIFVFAHAETINHIP